MKNDVDDRVHADDCGGDHDCGRDVYFLGDGDDDHDHDDDHENAEPHLLLRSPCSPFLPDQPSLQHLHWLQEQARACDHTHSTHRPSGRQSFQHSSKRVWTRDETPL